MPVTINFSCGGCDKEINGTTFLRRRFHSMNGKGYGFGHWTIDTAEDVILEGWVAFDPYTGCCYCPDCWEAIIND